jgi:hypothetical protein
MTFQRNPTPVSRWTAGLLAIGALAAGLFAWQREPADTPAAQAPATPPSSLPAQAAAPPPAHAQSLPALPEEPPLSVQVERLLATHDPADAYRAYWLIADCAEFNANPDRLIFDEQLARNPEPDSVPVRAMSDEEKRHDTKLCSGLTERERQSRLDYLAIAARAGVPRAAVIFATEGPFGDPSALKTRPGDPLVQEWKATANAQLMQAADAADMGALDYLTNNYRNGSEVVDQNPVLAARYGMALGLIYAQILGPDDMLAKMYTQQASQTLETAAGISPEQRAAELAAARRIADLAKARREQTTRKPGAGG